MMQYSLRRRYFPPIQAIDMPRASKVQKPVAATNEAQIRQELLVPIAVFLLKSGMSRAQLMTDFRLAIGRAHSSKLKITHMRSGQEVSRIVNRWLRDPIFLNTAGHPADLPLRGPCSIAALIKTSGADIAPMSAIAMLVEFGIVRKVSTRKYRLVRRLVDFGHPEYLPFEPNFRFLLDAVKVSTARLRKPKGAPGLFWQCADNPRISARYASQFLRFAQQRSLSFMHEVNDWLDEHEDSRINPRSKRVQFKRLGIGLFGICQ
jgi:hypothetical protein